MRTAVPALIYIDLPKSKYFFTQRVTFWQALVSIISIFFTSVDVAIDDILHRIWQNVVRVGEGAAVEVMNWLYPKWGYT